MHSLCTCNKFYCMSPKAIQRSILNRHSKILTNLHSKRQDKALPTKLGFVQSNTEMGQKIACDGSLFELWTYQLVTFYNTIALKTVSLPHCPQAAWHPPVEAVAWGQHDWSRRAESHNCFNYINYISKSLQLATTYFVSVKKL